MQTLRKSPAIFPVSKTLASLLTQSMAYVDVKMKWKKDSFFDSIPHLSHSRDLRPLLSLVSTISASSGAGIPVSDVSKRRRALETPDRRVASFLRRFPAVFDEFVGPHHNLPWFRLTPAAAALRREESAVFEEHRGDFTARLRRLLLMSRRHRLPLRVAKGMLWHLGLPEDYFNNPNAMARDGFQIADLEQRQEEEKELGQFGNGEDGEGFEMAGIGEEEEKELKLIDSFGDDAAPALSVLQMNEMRKLGLPLDSALPQFIPFPLFPFKGLRLKRKIEQWLDGFQRLHYISPYEDITDLDPNSDVSEKRAAGVLHELLSLFVGCSAERRRLLCLRKHLGLPQKFHRVFERHPHVFYLLLKEKTCSVVLKEAYCAGADTTIEEHPMLAVRKKYVNLMIKSKAIIRSRRSGKPIDVHSKDSEDWAVVL